MMSAPEEYRRPTPAELDELWSHALVVFDASTLLRLLEFSKRTSTACFNAMRALESRLWLPNQASFEFYKNTKNSRKTVGVARAQLDDLLASVDSNIYSGLRATKHPNLVDAFTEAWERSKNLLSSALDSADMPPDDLDAHFSALEAALGELYVDKVGPPYDAQRIEEICAQGEVRYKARIPPGFEDAKIKNVPDKFGDLIFWRQILDHAKATAKSIILVTDDQKDDWWLNVVDRQKPDNPKIVVGPHPLLIREMRTFADQRLWMYVMSDFVAESRERLKVKDADQAVIAEIKQNESTSNEQRKVQDYNVMLDLRRRLDAAHGTADADGYAQIAAMRQIRGDLASWSESTSESQIQQQNLLDRMGMGGALSQIPSFISVQQELTWLDTEIARLRAALGLGA